MLPSPVTSSAAARNERRAYRASVASKSVEEEAAPSPAPEKEKRTGAGGESSPAAVSSWGPDPVTGDYRPGSRAAEVDVAELRRRVLPH
ncbi:unnamed protein product [Spirodela intermedia]|uniref:Uncharacterized protein n=1 Tax=Spirodela intermedia TaxID=51605 RepID=A0A7I8LMC2_SPIIN|nr:unnamed protein product [Spirodela intermedia]